MYEGTMARQLGIKGTIPPTQKRQKSIDVRERKMSMDIDCFWSVSDSSEYEDDEALIGLR